MVPSSPKSLDLANPGCEKRPRGRPRSGKAPRPRNKHEAALGRIKVLPEQLHNIRKITHILENAAGGIPQVIDALRGYDDEDAQAFVNLYDSLSKTDKHVLSLEEIALGAEVSTLDLLAAATKALFIENQTISGIIAATSHPEVVRKTVEMALEDGGHRDREMLHIGQGFLPAPKGSIFISQRIQVANFKDKPNPSEEPPEGEELPSMDDEILALDNFERKLLQAPK